ncbi:hypothetical protein HZC21_04975 [Candidatus Peregrinibacteria bacterium]|nr:hypothetical protein [Candidatus Peregrinibacteria bacterium]
MEKEPTEKPSPTSLAAEEARLRAMARYRQQIRDKLVQTDFNKGFRLLQEAAHRNGGILPGSSPNSLPNMSGRPPIVPEEFRPDPT